MTYDPVQHTHALNLDLRPARGGSPGGVARLASFLFGDGDVHLIDIVEGPQGPARRYSSRAEARLRLDRLQSPNRKLGAATAEVDSPKASAIAASPEGVIITPRPGG